VATCRFILGNLAETATVKNGSGGGAPARSEASPLVMERALNPHRRSLWKGGSANCILGYTAYQLDIDVGFIGGAQQCTAAAIHGLSSNIQLADLYTLAAYPGTVPDYVGLDSVTVSGRDAHSVFPSLASQYWSLVLTTSSGPPTVGRLVLGSLVDLGVAPNPGSQSSEHQHRLEQVAEDGSVTLLELGYPGHDFTLNFDPCSQAVRTKLRAIAAHRGSVTYIDPENRCFEVFVRGGRPDTSSVNTSFSSVSLEMARLP